MRLVLTKPIGRRHDHHRGEAGVATAGQVGTAVSTMTTLNAAASRARGRRRCPCRHRRHGLRAARAPPPDVLQASGYAAAIDAAAVPLLPGVLELAQRDVVAGGTEAEPRLARRRRPAGALTTMPEQLVLADAQTSGGHCCIATSRTPWSMRSRRRAVDAWRVGSWWASPARRGPAACTDWPVDPRRARRGASGPPAPSRE